MDEIILLQAGISFNKNIKFGRTCFDVFKENLGLKMRV